MTRWVLTIGLLAGLLLPVAHAARAATPVLPGCDPIGARCLLPFPDDFYTVADPSTPTGRRVHLPALGMPINTLGKLVDPTEWNRNDGFSPGSALLTLVPGIDLRQTFGIPNPITDIARSLRADSAVVVVDAATGARQAVWAEKDQRPGVPDDQRLLIIHPANDFLMGHHYVVGLRHLRRADGSVIPRAVSLDSRAADLALLQRAGVDRTDLFIAWDFTIASAQNLAGRVLHIRDDAFASLGDTNLADGKITGRAPAFAITKVTESPETTTARRVEGTITVPNYLTPQVLTPPVSSLPPFAVPGTRFFSGSPDGLPVRDPLQPDLQVPFVCDIPRAAATAPSHPVLYGHGLLGSRDEVNGGSGGQLRRHDFTTCATDWIGFASEDIPNALAALVDLSNFPSVADRAQQGFLNFMFLGRALAHPQGLASSPAFHTADGRPLMRSGELYYDGNSQGAIMGGALTALDPDLTTAVLGVPGMNYSVLLDRSTDWYGTYFTIYSTFYRDPIEQEIGYNLLQMLWDRAEADGFAQHMTGDPLPNTPAHHVMLQVGFGDHQVSNIAAEVEARTIGARLKTPALRAGLHWSVDPSFGLVGPDRGSYIVYWYDPTARDATPPVANLPDQAGNDPHEYPRRDRAAGDQEARFLLTGQLIDTCAGGPCITTPATRQD